MWYGKADKHKSLTNSSNYYQIEGKGGVVNPSLWNSLNSWFCRAFKRRYWSFRSPKITQIAFTELCGVTWVCWRLRCWLVGYLRMWSVNLANQQEVHSTRYWLIHPIRKFWTKDKLCINWKSSDIDRHLIDEDKWLTPTENISSSA